MKSLAKWQFISLISRGLAVGVGLVQSFFILRILTVSEWGVVQIAIAVGETLGIYQHLGLASGSTREISSAKNKSDIFKIFATSVSIRYLVTIPLSMGLFFMAENIGVGQYGNQDLVLPLKLYAVALLFRGLKGLLNSLVAGMKRFKTLFTYQAIISITSLLIFVPGVYYFSINGYFFAFLAYTILEVIVLGFLALYPLRKDFSYPTKADFERIIKQVIFTSAFVYLMKILYTTWERSGPLFLGYVVSEELVAYLAFGLLFAKKIVHVSDAVTDVNLPVLTDKYTNNKEEYKSIFVKNFAHVFSFIVFSASAATFWAPELVHLFVGDKYNTVLPLIAPLVFTYVFYSLMNIIVSSVFIPGKFFKDMIIGFSMLLFLTIGLFFGLTNYELATPLSAMAIGMFIASCVSFTYLIIKAHKLLSFDFFVHDHVLILIQGMFISLASTYGTFFQKVIIFLIFVVLYIWGLFIAKFFEKKDLNKVLNLIKNFKR